MSTRGRSYRAQLPAGEPGAGSASTFRARRRRFPGAPAAGAAPLPRMPYISSPGGGRPPSCHHPPATSHRWRIPPERVHVWTLHTRHKHTSTHVHTQHILLSAPQMTHFFPTPEPSQSARAYGACAKHNSSAPAP